MPVGQPISNPIAQQGWGGGQAVGGSQGSRPPLQSVPNQWEVVRPQVQMPAQVQPRMNVQLQAGNAQLNDWEHLETQQCCAPLLGKAALVQPQGRT